MRMDRRFFAGTALAAGALSLLIGGAAFAGTWSKDGSTWRYTNDYGQSVESGWIQDDGAWYYFVPDRAGKGRMLTGWAEIDDEWYYLDPSTGAMTVGWTDIGGKWYYLDPAEGGAMATSRTVDGWHLNAAGVWDDAEAASYTATRRVTGTSSTRTVSRSSSDDEDDDEEEEDFERSDRWDDSGAAQDGPGFHMDTIFNSNSGPGANLDTDYSKANPSAYESDESRLTGPSSTGRVFGSARQEEDDDEDYDEIGGTKEDYLRYVELHPWQDTRDTSDYDGDYGSKFDFSVTTITDDDGNTRTIINKTKNERAERQEAEKAKSSN